MPVNGDINSRFGVYESLCCGAEIVISEGSHFPVCPKHPRLTTTWKPANYEYLFEEPLRRANELWKKKKSGDTAA